jgi:hypothetical protein
MPRGTTVADARRDPNNPTDTCESLSICSDKGPDYCIAITRGDLGITGFWATLVCGDYTIRGHGSIRNDVKLLSFKNSASRQKLLLLPHNDAINSWQHCDAADDVDADSCQKFISRYSPAAKHALTLDIEMYGRNHINPPPFFVDFEKERCPC